jgi:hypothetical protein
MYLRLNHFKLSKCLVMPLARLLSNPILCVTRVPGSCSQLPAEDADITEQGSAKNSERPAHN